MLFDVAFGLHLRRPHSRFLILFVWFQRLFFEVIILMVVTEVIVAWWEFVILQNDLFSISFFRISDSWGLSDSWFKFFYYFIQEVPQEIFEIILSNNCSSNSGQFLLAPSLNVKLYYGANSNSRGINGRSLDRNFSKQALPKSVHVVVYISGYIEDFVTMDLVLDLRGNSQLLKAFKVTLFHYKVILIKVIFL